ncbi:a-factor receptor, partial [Ascosphaera aggregata]
MIGGESIPSINDTWPLSSYGIPQWQYEYLKANDEYFTKLAPAGQRLLALSAVGIPVAIPPIIVLWRNSNIPGIQLGVLFLYSAVTNLINALIWQTDDMMTWWSGLGLCDLEVRLQAYMATTMGTTCTSILWSLASALNVNQTGMPTSRQKRNRFAIECILCCVVPAT